MLMPGATITAGIWARSDATVGGVGHYPDYGSG